MAKISKRAGAANIPLGSWQNTRQSIVIIPAALTADKPGLLFLESIDDGATASDLGGVYLWADDANAFHVSATYPTDQDDASTIIAATSTDATLLSIAALGTGADKMLYTTGVDTWAELAVTSYGRSILDDTSEAVFKATVNLEIGTDVQAHDAGLTNLAAVAMVADRMYYTSADNVHVATPITSAGRALIDDAAASNQRTTLGLVIGTNVAAAGANSDITGLSGLTGAIATPTTITATGDVSIDSDTSRLRMGDTPATDSYIGFDGASMVFKDIDGAVEYTLKELATGTTLNPTVYGDLAISDGNFTWTNADDESATWTIAAVANDGIDIIADGVTTAAALHIHNDNKGAAGSILMLDTLESGMNADGRYLTCYNHNADALAIKRYGEIEIAGLEGSDMFTITAGDAVITEGSLTITDNDDATTLSVTNDNITTNTSPLALFTSTATDGVIVSIDGDDLSASGTFFNITDGAATPFSIKLNGATAIAGSAHGTDAITITAGDITLTDGFIEAGATASGTGHGHTFATADDGTNDTALVTMSNSVAAFDMPLLQLTGASSGDVNTMQITNAGTGYGISETMSLAAGEGVEVIFATGGTHNGIFIDGGTGTYVGADTYGMLKIHQTGTLLHANASAIFVDFDGTPAASGLGYAINVDDDASAIGSSYAVSINSAANNPLKLETGAVGTTALTVKNVASATASTAVFDGTTTSWIGNADDIGMVQIKGDTANAHTGGTLLHARNTAQLTASSEGAIARFLASGTATTNAYAVEIAHTTTGGALNVSAGYSTFVDKATFTAGVQSSAVALTANDAGVAIPAGTSYVSVAYDADAAHRVLLPVPVLGNIIVLQEAAAAGNWELSVEADTQYINGTLCNGSPTKELLITSTDIVIAVCTLGGASGKWIVTKYSNAGLPAAGGTPD